MGLDQYLTKKYYIGAEYEHNGISGEDFKLVKTQQLNGVEGKPISVRSHTFPVKNLSEITYRVGYWRKANHIHKWFVDNVQNGEDDCGTYDVSLEKLKKLTFACRETLHRFEKAKKVVRERNRVSSEDKIINLLFTDEIYADNVADITELFQLQKGFFFGADFMGQWFFDDLEYTISIIEPEIEEIEQVGNSQPFYTTIEYSSSW